MLEGEFFLVLQHKSGYVYGYCDADRYHLHLRKIVLVPYLLLWKSENVQEIGKLGSCKQ